MKHFYKSLSGENWMNFEEFYKYLVNKFPSGSIFVEIGSWKGRSAAYMIVEILNSKKLIDFYCVDTFEGTRDLKQYIGNESLYGQFIKNLEPVKNHYKVLKMTSIEAAKCFDDKSIDAVFIDAQHTYEAVKADILAWLPKVKLGGILSGHDINHSGVKQAVDELLKDVQTVNPALVKNKLTNACWTYEVKV